MAVEMAADASSSASLAEATAAVAASFRPTSSIALVTASDAASSLSPASWRAASVASPSLAIALKARLWVTGSAQHSSRESTGNEQSTSNARPALGSRHLWSGTLEQQSSSFHEAHVTFASKHFEALIALSHVSCGAHDATNQS